MQVTILGTGAAIPDGHRMQTGYLVESEEYAMLVDCGSGVFHRLAQTDVEIDELDCVLLSHLHLDHVSDLLSVLTARWLLGDDPLPVVGPSGTLELLTTLRDLFPPLDEEITLDVREWDGGNKQFGPIAVAATETVHSIPCYAYRVTANGGSVTLSGDTEANDSVIEFADGSDFLVHDCAFPDEMDIANHASPTQLGAAIAGSDIDHVLLTHLYPVTAEYEADMCEQVGRRFEGSVSFAEDLDVIDV